MFPFFCVKLNFVMHNVCKMHWHGNWTFCGHANLWIDDSLDKTICGQDNSHTRQFTDSPIHRQDVLQTCQFADCGRLAERRFADKRDYLWTNCLKSPLKHLPLCT